MSFEPQNYLRFVLAFLIIVILLLGLYWALRVFRQNRFNPKGKKTNLEILETRMLDSKNRLAQIHWHGKEYLLLIGESSHLLIDKKESANEPKN
jgi:flagellar biogenesis protein FliO